MTAFWSILFTAFFAALAFAGLGIITTLHGMPHAVPVFDLILIILATLRLTRFVVYDAIMKFFRDWFADAPDGTFRGTLRSLVNCAFCTGLWFSLFVVFFYFLTPAAWFFILFLAVAEVASVVQVLSNLLGWHAESKKREVLIAELAEQDPGKRRTPTASSIPAEASADSGAL